MKFIFQYLFPSITYFQNTKTNLKKDENFCQESSQQPMSKKRDATTHPTKKTNKDKISQISFILMSFFFSSHHKILNTPTQNNFKLSNFGHFGA